MRNRWIVLGLVSTILFVSCVTTGIYGAAKSGDLNKLRALLKNDETLLEKKGLGGQTLLHNAAESGNLEVVSFLVDRGANINAKDSRGASVLHYAVYTPNANRHVLDFLLSKGCDINAIDKNDVSVLHYAATMGNIDMVRYLVSKGADIKATDDIGQTPSTYIQGYAEDDHKYQEIIAFLSSVEWGSGQQSSYNAFQVETNYNQKPVFSNHTRAEVYKTETPSPRTGKQVGKSYAIVIGNDQYFSFPLLKTAVNDANAVAHLLETTYNFDCKTIYNGTRFDILQSFDALRSKLSRSDNLLIFYAGHGFFDQKADRGYWLPVDAQPGTSANWISNADITDKLRAIDANHIMVVADSCYSGTLTRGVSVTIRNPDYFQQMEALRSRTVLTSGGMEPVADNDGGNHSVFAQAFLAALEQNTGTMDGTELFTKIRRPVMLNSDQTPEYSDIRKAGHEGGDFLFVRK